MSATHRVAGIRVSELTAGFVSWFEEVSELWRARSEGEKVPLPGWALFGLLFAAAVCAALAVATEVAVHWCAAHRALISGRTRGPRVQRWG